jgi:GNAT superfamily N-acetyltransferase
MPSIDQTLKKIDSATTRDILEFRRNEIEYWRALYREIPGSMLTPGILHAGPFYAFKMPEINILAYNRVLVDPDNRNTDPSEYLDRIIYFYRRSSIPRFFLQLTDALDTPAFREALYNKGFMHYNEWTRLSRPASLPVRKSTGRLRTVSIGKSSARQYARIIVQSFDFPDALIPHFVSTVGYPGFFHYLVYEKNKAIAAGALFTRGGYASIAIAGTLPEHRGKGAQGELLRERILKARSEGCRWITVETSRETVENKVASYRNMIRYGFSIAYHRPNFIFYP